MKKLLLLFFLLGLNIYSNLFAQQTGPLNWAEMEIPVVGDLKLLEQKGIIYGFQVFDFNGDGKDEVAVLRKDSDHLRFLTVKDYEKDTYLIKGYTLPPKVVEEFAGIFNISKGQNYKYATVSLNANSSLIQLYNSDFTIMGSFESIRGYDLNGDGAWSGPAIGHFNSIDVNGDYRNDLLFKINTGSDGQPRKIVAHDLLTKKVLLDRSFAPMLRDIIVADLERDGSEEIVVTFSGASDGPFFGNFARDSTYLAIFNSKLELLKKFAFGGESTYLHPFFYDINNDQVLDIIMAFFSRLEFTTDNSSIYIIDGKTKNIVSKYSYDSNPSTFEECFVKDIDGDDIPEIITTNRQGEIFLLHYSPLTNQVETKKRVYAFEKSYLGLIDDLNFDGRKELVFSVRNPAMLVITDCDLNPLARLPLPESESRNAKVQKYNETLNGMNEYIVVHDQKIYKASFPVNEIFPPHALTVNYRNTGFQWNNNQFQLFLFFAAICSVLIVIFVAVMVTTRKGLVVPESDRINAAIVNRKNRVLISNKSFDNIFNLRTRADNRNFIELLQPDGFLALKEMYADFKNSRAPFIHKERALGPAGNLSTYSVEMYKFGRGWKEKIEIYLINLSESTQSDRVKLWAALAQRIAHKTKTPLGTVMLAIQRLQREYFIKSPEQAEEYDKFSKTALTEIKRVRNTLNTFMKFAKLNDPIFVVMDLNECLNNLLDKYKSHVPEKVKLNFDFDPGPIPVKVDQDQFTEVIHNILDNALTAMKGEGDVEIRTLVETHPLSDYGGNDNALIEIIDSGAGVSPEELKDLFKPGYTTSEHGSGMGLAITKAIVESFDGEIFITSKQGIGTTVSIHLPKIKTGDNK